MQTPQPPDDSERKIIKKVSKRVITERIEGFFSSSGPPLKSPKQHKKQSSSFSDWFKLWTEKFRFFRLTVILFVVMGVLLAGGWGYWYWGFGNPKEINKIVINPLFGFQSQGSIVATPLLVNSESRETTRIIFADLLGNVLALDGNGALRYEYVLKKGVISSLTGVEVDNKEPKETLVVDEEGGYVVLNQHGNYLYKSRDEFFDQNIFAKPAFIPEEQLYVLAGRKGTVWGVDVKYGEVRWMNDSTPLSKNEGAKIFSAPLVFNSDKGDAGSSDDGKVNSDIWVVSEDGHLVALQKENGFLSWHLDLRDGFKASMVKGRFLADESLVALASLSGVIYLVNEKGELRHRVRLNQPILATPARMSNPISRAGAESLLVATESGNVYRINFQTSSESTQAKITTKIDKVFSGSSSFISSPVSIDLNRDKIDDFILIDRTGEIIILDGKNFKMLNTPFKLNYQVSATPLVADITGNGELELIIGGENGKIEVLRLEYFPKYFFSKYKVFYSEFLKDSLNQNY